MLTRLTRPTRPSTMLLTRPKKCYPNGSNSQPYDGRSAYALLDQRKASNAMGMMMGNEA